MNFFKQLILGFRSYYAAMKFIHEHRMYWYFLLPSGLMLLIYFVGDKVRTWQSGWDPSLGCTECATMNDTIWFLIKLLISVTIGLTLMKFAKYIVVILLSPLFSILSQLVEKKITGKTYPFELRQTIHDTQRGIRIALRNIMWEYIFFFLILIVTMIGWDEPMKSPVFYLTYAVAFFYYGFSFIDYINERRRLDIDQSIHFMRNHRGLAIAIGTGYSVMILVPVNLGELFDYSDFLERPYEVLGNSMFQLFLWMMASASPILAIIAATLAMHELVDLNTNRWARAEGIEIEHEQTVNNENESHQDNAIDAVEE
jgi:CysZ protein